MTCINCCRGLPKKLAETDLQIFSRNSGKMQFAPGLPDGIFSNIKSQIGHICLRWANAAIFYGRLEYFTDICDIL
jgi:hypothetical protein